MNRLLTRLLDPWRWFALVSLGLGVALIIVPQLWIFAASMLTEGGSFTIAQRADRMDLVPETLSGFKPDQETGQDIVLSRDGQPVLAVHRIDGTTLEVVGLVSGSLSATVLGANTATLEVAGLDLTLRQQTPSLLFASPGARRGLVIDVADGRLRLTHNAKAFLRFDDPSLHATLSNYARFLTENRFLRAIRNSLIVTFVASGVASVIAVSLAFLLARYDVPAKSLIVTLVTMASVSPPFLGAFAWRMLLGANGLITSALGLDMTIVGIHGVIWVSIWLIFPLIFLLTYDSFLGLDQSLIESSYSQGANRLRTFLRVEVPLAMPGVMTGLYLAMMAAFSDFGTPYIISIDLQVLPVLVYTEFLNEVGGNASTASTGAVVMIAISTAILLAQRLYLASRSFASVSTKRAVTVPTTPIQRFAILAFAGLVLALAFVPHVTVLVTSFLEWRVGTVTAILSLANYVNMVNRELRAVGVSLFIGTVATVACVGVGIGIGYVLVRKRYRLVASALNLIVMLPYIVPGTVLGIGFIMIFNEPPFLITGTWLILALSYFVRMLPFSVKSAESALHQIHPAFEEAAMGLGARPMRSFRDITLPLIVGGVVTGATLTFLHTMTELSSTIILYRPPWKPMTAVIFENTVSAGADFGIAAAMTVLLMLLLYVPLYYVTKRTRRVVNV